MCVDETPLIKLIGFANESHHFLYKGTFSNRDFLAIYFKLTWCQGWMQFKIVWRPLKAITDPLFQHRLSGLKWNMNLWTFWNYQTLLTHLAIPVDLRMSFLEYLSLKSQPLQSSFPVYANCALFKLFQFPSIHPSANRLSNCEPVWLLVTTNLARIIFYDSRIAWPECNCVVVTTL